MSVTTVKIFVVQDKKPGLYAKFDIQTLPEKYKSRPEAASRWLCFQTVKSRICAEYQIQKSGLPGYIEVLYEGKLYRFADEFQPLRGPKAYGLSEVVDI
jgi:hypothetical protein